jgi:hypothetical protein
LEHWDGGPIFDLSGYDDAWRIGNIIGFGAGVSKSWQVVTAWPIPRPLHVWYALVSPKGTPAESWPCSMWLSMQVLADLEILARFTEVGGFPMPMTASELDKLIANENQKWHKLIEFAGISINNRATPGGN